MAKSWNEVESSQGYVSLSPGDKAQTKREYWGNILESKTEFKMLDRDSQSQAKSEFLVVD